MRYKIHDTQYALRSPLYAGSYYNIFPDTQIMQNKANLGNDKMNITIDITSNYEEFAPLAGLKNKANSNPIKAKTKPIQTQLKPKQSQFKPNQSQSLTFWALKDNI
ncbi:MAG: hypothetical protein H8D56_16275 [Planctomycetes bacterium]|nr:hypothetical protein [Planctomycetota bacterium]MBL7146353.1 hypothetical protein [Phycisphaerae bacterium]